MDTQYKVVFTGRLLPGFDRDDVVTNLTTKTNLDRERAEKLVSSEKQVMLKKGLDRENAEKFRDHFQKTGLQIRIIEPGQAESPKQAAQPAPQKSAAEPLRQEEKKSSPTPKPSPSTAGDISPENPYAAPRANLKTNKHKTGVWLDQPRKVSATMGFRWIKSAIVMFINQPWKWLAMAFIGIIIVLPLTLLPIIGPLLNTPLAMVLAGGLMLAARHQDQGNAIRIKLLFEGFRHNRNQLLLVGLIYLGFFFVFGMIMALFVGTGIFTFMGGGLQNPEAVNAMMQKNMATFPIMMLVMLALSIPVIMAVWFATPLVALADQTAWEAYKMSFRACLKNWLAFLVYGLAGLLLMVVIMIAIGVISGLLAFFFSSGKSFLISFLPMVFMIPMWLAGAIIGGLTVFTSFKDIYYQAA